MILQNNKYFSLPHLAIICFFICLFLLSNASAKSQQNGEVLTLSSPPPNGVIGEAFLMSFNALSHLGDKVITSRKGIGFQTFPDENHSVTVLLVDSNREKLLPRVCEAQKASELDGVLLTDYQNRSGPIQNKGGGVILCNKNFFEEFLDLQYSMHDPDLLLKYSTTDAGYMSLLRKISDGGMQELDYVKGVITEDHMFGHMVYLVTYILAHELYHLGEGVVHAEYEPKLIANVKSWSTSKLKMCQNYKLFESHGYALSGDRGSFVLGEFAEVGIPDEFKEMQSELNKIWLSEIEADKYASNQLIAVLNLMQADNGNSDESVIDYLQLTFSSFALKLWYERLYSFSMINCREYVGKDYFLTRCMCEDRKKFSRAANLFSLTHPPQYLRVAKSLDRMLQNVDISGLSELSKKQLVARRMQLDHLMDTPIKMAMGACMLENIEIFEDTKTVFFDFTALEGFHENYDVNFIGAPSSSIRAEIMDQCFNQ